MFVVIEEDYNFDNQRIYKDFERQFDYKLMRSVYDSLESEWLSRGDLRDTVTCPDRLFPYTTEEQTLFNEMYVIDSEYTGYSIEQSGTYWGVGITIHPKMWWKK